MENKNENFARASLKDVIKYKIKWVINTIYKPYGKYIGLYDFEDLF
ncbi:hypothetical protein KSU03_06000 [Fusobacterium polymorphum]|nr:hypothetical protein [Fusobacterium polymorphum]